MHQQRTDVLRTSGRAPTRHRVRGLGICDVLEFELDPAQIDGLIAEIDDLCVALEQSISELVAARSHEALKADRSSDESVRRHLHQIAVARAIRGQLVTGELGPTTVLGPARILPELIDGATRSATEALARKASERQIAGTSGTARAAELAANVEAWMARWSRSVSSSGSVFEPDDGTGGPA